MTDLSPLQFEWVRTWPEQARAQDDWKAHPYPDDPTICRITKDATTPGRMGLWRWTACGDRAIATGWERTANLATRACEKAFFDAVADGRTRAIGEPPKR